MKAIKVIPPSTNPANIIIPIIALPLLVEVFTEKLPLVAADSLNDLTVRLSNLPSFLACVKNGRAGR